MRWWTRPCTTTELCLKKVFKYNWVLLPLRHTFMRYKKNRGMILILSESSEMRTYNSEDLNMFIMCCQVLILSHDSVVNRKMCIFDYLIMHISSMQMSQLMKQTYLTPLKWMIELKAENLNLFVLMSRKMQRCTSYYLMRSFLSVYTNLTVLKSVNHFSDCHGHTDYVLNMLWSMCKCI